MPRGRPPFRFLLIDLPSDHEIDGGIVTECEVIRAILHNRNFGGRTKTIRATSLAGLDTRHLKPYSGLGFVHLSAHGGRKGISLIGDRLSWKRVAKRLQVVAPVLANGEQRVLSLSCCYSPTGFSALRHLLQQHFTAIYHFNEKKISFATAMTVWSMFYRKKTIDRPALAVAKHINKFFDREVIVYREL